MGRLLGQTNRSLDQGYYLGQSNELSGSAGQAAAGAASGASTGAMVGSVIPGVGNLIGAGAGAVIGTTVGLLSPSSHTLNKSALKNAPNDKVTVFDDAAFNGYAKSYGPGEFVYLGKGGRDEISSVKVPKGLKLEVFHGGTPQQINQPGHKHYNKQPAAVFTESTRYVGDQHNDKIDTLRVSLTDEAKELMNEQNENTDTQKAGLFSGGGDQLAQYVKIGGGMLMLSSFGYFAYDQLKNADLEL